MPPIWPRFMATLAITLVPSTMAMLHSMTSQGGNFFTTPMACLLFWALPSWFILLPTFRASGGWRHTSARTRFMVPSLFGIALGVSTFITSVVVRVALLTAARP